MKPIDDGLLLSIEDGLRATSRDLAQAMPDDSIPPLPPPSRQPDRHVARPSLGQRIRRLFAPLTAATAVVATLVSPPAIAHGMALMATAHPDAGQVRASGLPPYYVLVRKTGIRHGGNALITSTASGRALAVVSAPRTCTFVSVTGGVASDRTFVLGGQNPVDGTPCLTLLTFAVRRHGQITTTVRPLKVAFTPGSLLALSPDGARLALAQSPGMELTIVTLATGASQTWITDNSWWDALSWQPGGRTIQYCRRAYSSPAYHCGALNVSPAGPPRPAGPERLLDFDPGQHIIGVTPDGTVFSYRLNRSITEVSLHPFQVVENLGHIAQANTLLWGTAGILWTNSLGSIIIVSISPGSSSPPAPVELMGSQYWQLPGNFGNASSIAW